MKTNTKTKKKNKYEYDSHSGYGNDFTFGNFYNNKVNEGDTCKEEFINSLWENYEESEKHEKIVFTFSGKNPNWEILHSFERDFRIPLTKIDEQTDKYVVFFVPKKWRVNWVTLGLFLELARASVLYPEAKNWKGLMNQKLNHLRGKFSFLRNSKKVAGLWNPNFQNVCNQERDIGANNCVYYLQSFDFGDHLDGLYPDEIDKNWDNLTWLREFARM